MRIRIDFDNTMVASQAACVEFYNRAYATQPVSLAEITSYHTPPRPDWRKAIHAFYRDPQLYVDHVQPYPFALNVVERLARVHAVEIVSGFKRDDTTPRKRAVLERHQPSLAGLLRGVPAGTKQLSPADVTIDDEPSDLEAEKRLHPATTVLGIDQPYNRRLRLHPDVRILAVATNGWLVIEALILSLAQRHRITP